MKTNIKLKINEIEKQIKETDSTDYKTYLSLYIKHIEKYGIKPELEYIGKSYNNLELWNDGEPLNKNPLKIDNVFVCYKDNKVYEISSYADIYIAKCTVDEYMKYKDFICWNSYIGIL